MSNKENNLDKYLNQSLNIDIVTELESLYKVFNFHLPDTFCTIPREYFVALKRLNKPMISTSALAILNEFFDPRNRDEAQEVAELLRETSNVLKVHYSPIIRGFSIWETNVAFLDKWVESFQPSKQKLAENRIRDLLGFRFQEDFVEAFIEEYRSMTPKEFNRWYYSNIETRWQSEIKLKELVNFCQVAHEGEKGWNYDNIKKRF